MSNKTEENNNEIILNKTQEENDNDNDNEIIKNENDKENEEYMIKIYCKELKKNILNDKKINVSINKCSLVKSNNLILNNSYIIYDITTSNKEKDPKDKINYKVQRRYSDFIQLRETLSKFFPYNYIPSLPEKSPEYLSKEENGTKLLPYLNIFINAIISQEEFKAFEATFLHRGVRCVLDLHGNDLTACPLITFHHFPSVSRSNILPYLSKKMNWVYCSFTGQA